MVASSSQKQVGFYFELFSLQWLWSGIGYTTAILSVIITLPLKDACSGLSLPGLLGHNVQSFASPHNGTQIAYFLKYLVPLY
jgi:hypothetical protein